MGHCVIIGPNAALSRSRTQSEGESPEDTVRITLDASAAGGTFSLEGVDVLLDCFLLVFLDVAGSASTSPASMSADYFSESILRSGNETSAARVYKKT